MTEANVELVRRIYEAWNATDLGLEHFDPRFELHQAPSLIDSARVFRGHYGLLRAAGELNSDMLDLTWEPGDFVIAEDNRIVVPFRFRGRGRTSGIPTDTQAVHVWTLRDGSAIRCDTYETMLEALAVVGLGE